MAVTAAAFKAGTVLDGRYRLGARLAMTRFSCVFRGEQLSTGQTVAIKVLELGRIPASGRAGVERRFRREMAIYSEVRHPNLVRLLDTGRAGEDLYLVLEFVEGRSLSRVLRDEGQLAPFEARHLMGQCLDALSAGHARGIVHRDFKPDNVMITSTGSERHAVVLDFGLAGLREGGARVIADGGGPITTPGTIPGTPVYMAPEQIRSRVVAQTDIYAWGLVYLECLTGRRAVDDSGTPMQVLVRQLREPLVLPDWLEAHPLGALLRRATAKDLETRYEHAHEVLEALRSCPMGGLAVERADPLDRIEAPEDSTELDADGDDDLDELIVLEPDLAPAQRVVTLPSLLVTELPPSDDAVVAPPALPSPPAIAPAELAALYEDYARVCAALAVVPELELAAFVARSALEAEALRRELGCRAIRYRIVIDGQKVKLQPTALH